MSIKLKIIDNNSSVCLVPEFYFLTFAISLFFISSIRLEPERERELKSTHSENEKEEEDEDKGTVKP